MCLTCDMLNLSFLQPDSSAAAFGPGDVGPAKQQSTAEETKGSTDHKWLFSNSTDFDSRKYINLVFAKNILETAQS